MQAHASGQEVKDQNVPCPHDSSALAEEKWLEGKICTAFSLLPPTPVANIANRGE